VSSFDCDDDAAWIGRPSKGLRAIVGFDEKTVDGGMKIDDGSKDTPFQSAQGKPRKEAIDGIEPGARCGSEVEDEALVPSEPSGAFARSVPRGAPRSATLN
jgi:hypothetical protein